eukprot:gb/GECH01006634.1/.p1 GENE.gb/GECH01006634.1/~~gb/GECH01006634.1/.p1  ORF type:complete len:440 (+),score=59.47 gb/GECH01006634.1/:1-1320(+)
MSKYHPLKQEASINDVEEPTISEEESIHEEDSKVSTRTGGFIEALWNSCKSMVGIGILTLPYAVQNSGLWLGLATMLCLVVICDYTIKLLVYAKNAINEEAGEEIALSYEDVGGAVFGRWGRWLVQFSVVSCEIGVCCSYVIFIDENMNSVVSSVPKWAWALITLPLLLLLCFLPNMRYLAFTSFIAMIALALAIVVIFVYGFRDLTLENFTQRSGAEISTYPIFFGIAVFSFEGINMALPVENSMRKPQNYPLVIDITMVSVFAVVIMFALFGYVFFGEDTCSDITLNLPTSGVVPALVKISLSLELLFTYPIALWPVMVMLEELVLRKEERAVWDKKAPVLKRFACRTALVLFTIGISLAIPNLGLFIGLIGAISFSLSGFIIPPALHFWVFRKKERKVWLIIDIAIAALGIIGSAVSFVMTMLKVIRSYAGKEKSC